MRQPPLVTGLDEIEHIRPSSADRGAPVRTRRHGGLQRVATREDVVRLDLGSQVDGSRSILRHLGDTIPGPRGFPLVGANPSRAMGSASWWCCATTAGRSA